MSLRCVSRAGGSLEKRSSPREVLFRLCNLLMCVALAFGLCSTQHTQIARCHPPGNQAPARLALQKPSARKA